LSDVETLWDVGCQLAIKQQADESEHAMMAASQGDVIQHVHTQLNGHVLLLLASQIS